MRTIFNNAVVVGDPYLAISATSVKVKDSYTIRFKFLTIDEKNNPKPVETKWVIKCDDDAILDLDEDLMDIYKCTRINFTKSSREIPELWGVLEDKPFNQLSYQNRLITYKTVPYLLYAIRLVYNERKHYPLGPNTKTELKQFLKTANKLDDLLEMTFDLLVTAYNNEWHINSTIVDLSKKLESLCDDDDMPIYSAISGCQDIVDSIQHEIDKRDKFEISQETETAIFSAIDIMYALRHTIVSHIMDLQNAITNEKIVEEEEE